MNEQTAQASLGAKEFPHEDGAVQELLIGYREMASGRGFPTNPLRFRTSVTHDASNSIGVRNMVKPYTIAIPEEHLAAIRYKVSNYDWSQLPEIGGWRAGVGVADLKRLVNYWLHSYDWSTVEPRLNRLPNFVTEVDGECIHFLHLTGIGSKPRILLLHGWPGSYLEFERLWDPLTSDGHNVIVPSLPGFAFSNPITG